MTVRNRPRLHKYAHYPHITRHTTTTALRLAPTLQTRPPPPRRFTAPAGSKTDPECAYSTTACATTTTGPHSPLPPGYCCANPPHSACTPPPSLCSPTRPLRRGCVKAHRAHSARTPLPPSVRKLGAQEGWLAHEAPFSVAAPEPTAPRPRLHTLHVSRGCWRVGQSAKHKACESVLSRM